MKIMIVDDAEVQRFKLGFALKKAGYEVIEATDGQEGLETLEKNPDTKLIICDMHMPLMDGLTMSTSIHRSTTLTKPPVFMLTTEASQDLKNAAKENGVKAWILKPFKVDELLTAIASVLKTN